MRIGVVTGWEPRAGAGADGDFILRKPVRTSELLAQVAGDELTRVHAAGALHGALGQIARDD